VNKGRGGWPPNRPVAYRCTPHGQLCEGNDYGTISGSSDGKKVGVAEQTAVTSRIGSPE
jgi:hypothetical protein